MPHLNWSIINAEYFRLVNTIVPGPQSWTFFVPQILLPVSLLVPPHALPHHLHATLIFPAIVASIAHAVVAMRGPDVISMDTLWWSLYFLVLKDPRRDFKRVMDSQSAKALRVYSSGPLEAETKLLEWSYPSNTLSRLRWSFTLLSERPLTSWKIGQVSHDLRVSRPYITQSRSKFMKCVLLILLPALLLFMPLSLRFHAIEGEGMLADAPGALKSGNNDPSLLFWAPPSSILRYLNRTLPFGILQTLNIGLFLYSFLILHFLGIYLIPPFLSSLINPESGAAHTWSPHLWPHPHFGPFSAVLDCGLRGLWGSWWHQQMRHAVSEPGRWLSDHLGLGKGLVRYEIICASAFLLSGITHMGLVPPDVEDPWKLRLMIGAFFFVQPLGILVEVMLIEKIVGRVEAMLVETRLRTTVVRTLRLCWVLLFMSLPLRFLAVPFKELGYWNIWPPRFLNDGAQRVLRGEWIS